MAAAQQLARAGHDVTLFERDDRIGGLLRYGIPDFKMEKWLIDRRVEQMAAEGVTFRTGVRVGIDVKGDQLRGEFDAVVLSCGATKPRDLPVPGRDLQGIHFAMQFLPQQNKVNAGDTVTGQILATGKRVVILGGGDTGSDCLGTSNRQGAASVHQFELLPEPPKDRPPLVWPNWPMILRTSSSHEEGVTRDFSINTKAFVGDAEGRVRALRAIRLDWAQDNGRPVMKEIPGSEFEIPCELVLLALGFLGPETDTVVSQLGCELTERGNVKAGADYQTTVPGVFACGDARRGQSLVVWAIWEGREAARRVDAYLMGETFLPASPEL
jgi:glutamate synthase (NADPH/NADH) small chain